MNSYPNGQFTTLHGFFLVHGLRVVFGSSALAPSYLRIAKALPGSTGCLNKYTYILPHFVRPNIT